MTWLGKSLCKGFIDIDGEWSVVKWPLVGALFCSTVDKHS